MPDEDGVGDSLPLLQRPSRASSEMRRWAEATRATPWGGGGRRGARGGRDDTQKVKQEGGWMDQDERVVIL